MRPAATVILASAFVGFPLDFCFLFFLPFAKVEEKQESFTLRTPWGCRGIFPPAFPVTLSLDGVTMLLSADEEIYI